VDAFVRVGVSEHWLGQRRGQGDDDVVDALMRIPQTISAEPQELATSPGPGKRRNRSAWMLPDPSVQQWTVPGNASPHLRSPLVFLFG